jgi:hypothetical protein
MSKKLKDATIKLKHPDDHAERAGAMPDVRPSPGLENAERIPSEVGCYRTSGNKIVCGVVLAPEAASSHQDHPGRDLADSGPSSPLAVSTTVCVEVEDRGTRICRDVVIDAVEGRHVERAGLADADHKAADD